MINFLMKGVRENIPLKESSAIYVCRRKTHNVTRSKYLTTGKNNQKIVNNNGTFIRAIMSPVNILVSIPSPACIPLSAVVSSVATKTAENFLHIKGGNTSISICSQMK